ncbi:TonB-dependent receptor [Asticcacaulis benevestitus]|uniref:Secretin/TonB short N-terminal domain-containing protein n=1 Tax=Asticcacaulis benevestitus DSM 16100 = ATCC BAA-896 TaxID=1121022 RepID=V4PNF1_9CAUL|nr:TonB-dependent receptor [Asticcacaulis benevestitus]ESQ87015.1 hypothetical protein ABENE_17450 [Asticcacaulis benevestitus DSM 16100 = ATCC BAA-896]
MLNSKTLYSTTKTSILALMLGAALASSALAQAKPTYAFKIPSENTADALNAFAVQAKVHLLFPYDQAAKTSAQAVEGVFTREQALAKILEGTGLEIASQSDDTISLRTIQARPEASSGPATEVIVTGTHIRGGNPTSPVHVIDRKEIDRSGYADIGDVIRSLPENFSGGQNPGVMFANSANGDNTNLTNASTVNLRGLGTDATLTLLNGHRMASDGYFQASDISGVPLAAVQRIEVVPDGASALYGSDAVAGVANLILRKNYTGTDVSGRYGAATQGGGSQTSVSLLSGTASDTHYLMMNLELERQDPVKAGQRAFTANADPGTTLFQSQDRRSLFVAGGVTVSDQTDLSFDALVSDRTTEGQFNLGAVYFTRNYTPNYNLSVGVTTRLPGDWKLRVTGVAAGSRNSLLTEMPEYDYAGTAHYANSLSYIEAIADGTLIHLPTGDVKSAVGVGYRTETYQTWVFGDDDLYKGDRGVGYVFAEALVPLILADVARTGLEALELSVSARSEQYSDFGGTTNPRLGIRYVPFSDLTVRGTWGQSFKAPSFDKMYQPAYVTLYRASVRGYAGGGTALSVGGGNLDLKPETSTSWTLGADYTPVGFPGLRLSATYFDIDYTDRVVNPISSFGTALSNPIFTPFIDWSPTADAQGALIDRASEFNNFSGAPYDPSTVVAILKNYYTNASAQTARGVDLAFSQSFVVSDGTLNLYANGTWLQLDQQTISTVPEVRLSGTIFNAPDFKARAGLSYVRAGLSASSTVNYLSAETDTGVTPNDEIGSWTTVDANVAYRFQDGVAALKGTRLSLSIANLFDRDPPRANSAALAYPGLAFDSTNTSVMGRFISLTLSRTW